MTLCVLKYAGYMTRQSDTVYAELFMVRKRTSLYIIIIKVMVCKQRESIVATIVLCVCVRAHHREHESPVHLNKVIDCMYIHTLKLTCVVILNTSFFLFNIISCSYCSSVYLSIKCINRVCCKQPDTC